MPNEKEIAAEPEASAPSPTRGSPEWERELIRQSRLGDNRAFGELLTFYEKRVFSLVLRWVRRRDEAVELTQEVFLQAFRHRERFDATRPFRPWLFKIAINACRNHSRHGQRRELPSDSADDSAPLFALPSLTPEQDLTRDAERQSIVAALQVLSPEDRALVLCRFNDGLDYAELAELFGRSQTLLRMRLHRALKRLRSALGEEGRHEP